MKINKHLISIGLISLASLLVLATNGFLPAANASLDERINVAAAENGGVAFASSTYTPSLGGSYDADPAVTINDNRSGKVGARSAAWTDNTNDAWPDWLQVDFNGSQTIDEIGVFTLQDAYMAPIEPTETTTFSLYGLTAFEVQYWDLSTSGWLTVPGGNVTGNNKVWKRITFAPITTTKIRVLTDGSPDGYSRLTEVEAWATYVPPPPSPTPTPTPVPSPTPTPPPPEEDLLAALAQNDIYIDAEKHIGFGTPYPIFNDDGVTGAYVGKWFAIDGKFTDAAAYLGIGGTVPTAGNRVGALNFYNRAMGGVDNRTAAIMSFNGSQLGTGNLEFYTSPNAVGPLRRMQIAPTGEVGINHSANPGAMLQVMGKTADASTNALNVLNGADQPLLIVRGDGQVTVSQPGQGIVLKSPNGLICKKLTIDNSGNLVVQAMGSCP